MTATFSDAVAVSRRFQRSVRIDTDLSAIGALEGFVCHGSNRAVLETMARMIVESGQRAFTWTGPYGTGKSSLALALCASVSGNTALQRRAADRIGDVPRFREAFPEGNGGWLVVPVVGRPGDPIKAVREGIAAAIAAQPGRARTRRRIPDPAGRDVVERLGAEAALRPGGGVLLVMDEMGKLLDGARRGSGDLHFFQELAEGAARLPGRVIVLGILHQAFEQYATHAGRAAQEEWAKVQGRFVDIPLVTAMDEVVDLVGRTIECRLAHPETRGVANRVAEVIVRRRPGVSDSLGARLNRCWPLHPVTAVLLGPISRRGFTQNERSLFGFLGSGEPGGFQEFLQETPVAKCRTYDPARLWDYLQINFAPAIEASSDGHRWAQAVESMERCEARGSSLHLRLFKTVALIDLFRNNSGVMAELPVLTACAGEAKPTQVRKALRDLERWSVAIFRKHLGAYAIYGGSDFDLDEAVRAVRRAAPDLAVAELARLAGADPLVAKEHYYRTGTLRWFERGLASLDSARREAEDFTPEDGAAGKFVLVIPPEGEAETDVADACRKASSRAGEYPLAVGYPHNAGTIRALGAERIALDSVRRNAPEMESDSVARREVKARIHRTAAQLGEELRSAFDDAVWFVGGTTMDGTALPKLVTRLADETFRQAPVVHSELVNREKPSSNSQAAVRQLLHAMAAHPEGEHLGIEGFKAERGLYDTVLKASGFHRPENGGFGFGSPEDVGDPSRFGPMWRKAEEHLAKHDGRMPLVDFYEIWTEPPFGIRRGLLPLLGMAFLQANRASVAVYANGTFQPDVNDFVADQLLQSAGRIQLRKVSLTTHDQKLMNSLAEAVASVAADRPALEPLTVARALVRFAFTLPPWTRRTMSLSKEALAVRRVLLNASDPHGALFTDLPKVFGNVRAAGVGIGKAMKELQAAHGRMLAGLQRRMIKALAHHDCALDALRERARAVVSRPTGELRLDAFAGRLSTFAGTSVEMESLAGLAANRPPRDWTDKEPHRAGRVLEELALQFRLTEAFTPIAGGKPGRRAIAIAFAGDEGRTVKEGLDLAEVERPWIGDLADALLAALRNSGADRRAALAALVEAGVRVAGDGELDEVEEVVGEEVAS